MTTPDMPVDRTAANAEALRRLGGAEPVLLDVASIAPDRILLLDAFFYVVVFHGVR